MKKTKFISSEKCTGRVLGYQREAIEKVEEFHYIGSDLAGDQGKDKCSVAQMERVRKNALRPRCSGTLKGKLYRTIVMPALLTGIELSSLLSALAVRDMREGSPIPRMRGYGAQAQACALESTLDRTRAFDLLAHQMAAIEKRGSLGES
ncbi:unnamed protein product [Heligmosomoides polygyrus]|uniref:DNA-directed RNA polymerase n=1 Tax=Heligmosomoides polygyrus TaxID=6339 RepID=A0A183G6Z0_HELPZ|nr:unnamed protein product [Heligmosomoides polygyrus]